MLGMLVVILERYPAAAAVLSLFPLFWRYYCVVSIPLCATDDPMPNSARCRRIIAHCIAVVNGTATVSIWGH